MSVRTPVTINFDHEIYLDELLDSLSDEDLVEEMERRKVKTLVGGTVSLEKAAFAWNTDNKEEFLRLAKKIVEEMTGKILK